MKAGNIQNLITFLRIQFHLQHIDANILNTPMNIIYIICMDQFACMCVLYMLVCRVGCWPVGTDPKASSKTEAPVSYITGPGEKTSHYIGMLSYAAQKENCGIRSLWLVLFSTVIQSSKTLQKLLLRWKNSKHKTMMRWCITHEFTRVQYGWRIWIERTLLVQQLMLRYNQGTSCVLCTIYTLSTWSYYVVGGTSFWLNVTNALLSFSKVLLAVWPPIFVPRYPLVLGLLIQVLAFALALFLTINFHATIKFH